MPVWIQQLTVLVGKTTSGGVQTFGWRRLYRYSRDTFFRPQNRGMEKRLEQSAGHHDAFIEAIERRDESAVVDLVFEHWELSRENMEIFIAPQGIKADALVYLPPNSHSEHLS
ncbi:FCD domain-containing protein [Pseudomonas fluorescens]|uniref:FCD domain-containing protein n=1 Tax=Pseudomonas fluorescens TaxID=294 RepID=UPI002181F0BA|nr:FCD domain-containing protein [Pseudomonas fluorescens]